MKERLKRLYADYKYALVLGLLLVGAAVAVQLIVKERLEDLTATIQVQIGEQQTLLTGIAQATARNGADATTESIIKDCSVSERNEFDDLLGKLDKGLSVTELTTLERLFGRCGNFFAQRKSVMVARLTREIDVYAALVDQLETLVGEEEVEVYKVETWRQLADEERKLSEHFAELVVIQDDIITTLLDGKSAQSDEIKTILTKAQETQGMLIVTSKQAAAIRESLIPL